MLNIPANIGGFENPSGNGVTGMATVIVNFASPTHVGATFLLGVAVSLVREVSSEGPVQSGGVEADALMRALGLALSQQLLSPLFENFPPLSFVLA